MNRISLGSLFRRCLLKLAPLGACLVLMGCSSDDGKPFSQDFKPDANAKVTGKEEPTANLSRQELRRLDKEEEQQKKKGRGRRP